MWHQRTDHLPAFLHRLKSWSISAASVVAPHLRPPLNWADLSDFLSPGGTGNTGQLIAAYTLGG
jgi:hypothetical protein